MEVGYAATERAALNAKARMILDRSPDVGAFIRHGLSPRPEAPALIYLRTARDPAPVVTSAAEFLGLMNATRQWLRREGIGPNDVVAVGNWRNRFAIESNSTVEGQRDDAL